MRLTRDNVVHSSVDFQGPRADHHHHHPGLRAATLCHSQQNCGGGDSVSCLCDLNDCDGFWVRAIPLRVALKVRSLRFQTPRCPGRVCQLVFKHIDDDDVITILNCVSFADRRTRCASLKRCHSHDQARSRGQGKEFDGRVRVDSSELGIRCQTVPVLQLWKCKLDTSVLRCLFT